MQVSWHSSYYSTQTSIKYLLVNGEWAFQNIFAHL